MVRLLTIGFLFSAVWALHATMPQKNIFYIPAATGDIKVRPTVPESASMKVLSLEEAVARHEEKHGPIRYEAVDYNYDESDCLLSSCALEVELMMAKYRIRKLLRG